LPWREEFVERVEGGGERGAGVVVEAVEAVLQDRGARAAHGRELVAAGVGERDADRAGVGRVRGSPHEAVLLEAPDDAGHRRLGDELGGSEIGDPQRALLVQPPQREQRADGPAGVRVAAQELRQPREPALEQRGEERGVDRGIDSHTI
jgi:hypothetical protein